MIKSGPCNEHTEEIRIPVEMEIHARRPRKRREIPFSDETWQTIVEVADSLGAKAATA